MLNRSLNRQATEGARDCDVVVFTVEATRYGTPDREVLARIPTDQRIVAAVNKVDLVKDQLALLPFLERLQKERDFAALVPISARSGRNLPELLRVLAGLLPEGPRAYPAEQLTDRDERFFAAEILREKLFLLLGEELPYRCDVVLESFKEEAPKGRGRGLRRIEAISGFNVLYISVNWVPSTWTERTLNPLAIVWISEPVCTDCGTLIA